MPETTRLLSYSLVSLASYSNFIFPCKTPGKATSTFTMSVDFQEVDMKHAKWLVPFRYKLIEIIGNGAYGCVR